MYAHSALRESPAAPGITYALDPRELFVNGNDELHVAGNKLVSVAGDFTTESSGAHTETHESSTIQVNGHRTVNVGGDLTTEVTGTHTDTVGAGVLQVNGNRAVTVTGELTTETTGTHTDTVGGDSVANITGILSFTANGGVALNSVNSIALEGDDVGMSCATSASDIGLSPTTATVRGAVDTLLTAPSVVISGDSLTTTVTNATTFNTADCHLFATNEVIVDAHDITETAAGFKTENVTHDSTVISSNGDLIRTASTGNIGLTTSSPSGNITLNAGGQITGIATTGDINLSASDVNGDIILDAGGETSLTSGNGDLTVTASNEVVLESAGGAGCTFTLKDNGYATYYNGYIYADYSVGNSSDKIYLAFMDPTWGRHSYLYYSGSSNTFGYNGGRSNQNMNFECNGKTVLKYTGSTSSVGMGTSTPLHNLQVNSASDTSIAATSTSANPRFVLDKTTGGDSGKWEIELESSTQDLLFKHDGSVRFAFDSAGVSPRNVSGALWGTYSDQRIKQNIQPLDVAQSLQLIERVPLRSFDFDARFRKCHPEMADGRQIGVVAQEMSAVGLGKYVSMKDAIFVDPTSAHEVPHPSYADMTAEELDELPEDQKMETKLVYDKEVIKDLRTVNMSDFVFHLIGAVQLLSHRVKTLERSLASLKTSI